MSKQHDLLIPPLPATLVNIQNELSKSDYNLKYIADQISSDIALSASLLKTVNSPFFALREKILAIPQAITLLGVTKVVHLVTAESLKNTLKLPPGLGHFWERARTVAAMQASIAKHLCLNPDSSYLMGLFHDAAVPILATEYPNYYLTLRAMHSASQEICTAEYAQFNVCHSALSSLMARSWYMPKPLVEAIQYHHKHDIFALGLPKPVLNILTVHLICDFLYDSYSGEVDLHYPLIEGQVREYLNLSDDEHYQIVVDLALDRITTDV